MKDLDRPTLEIRLELPDRVKAGATVPVQLTIVNQSDHPLSLVTPLYNAAVNLVVFDAFWNIVAPHAVGKAHVAFDEIELAPNERRSVSLGDLSYVSGTGQMGFKLNPGAYYVVAVYHPGTSRLPQDSEYPIMAVSNVARLIID
jgi:hypothetical protein